MTERPLSREEVDLFLRLRPHSRRAFMAAFGATAAALTLSGCKPAEPEATSEGKLVIEGSEGNKLAFYN